MKKTYLILLILSLTTFTILAKEQEDKVDANNILAKGTREIGASFRIADDSDLTYSVSGRYSYFIKNKLAVGLLADVRREAGDTVTGLGATLQYYFCVKERLAPYIAQEILASRNDETDWFGNTQLGVAYFFTESVAFKTFGQLSYTIEDFDSPSFDFRGQFSFFF